MGPQAAGACSRCGLPAALGAAASRGHHRDQHPMTISGHRATKLPIRSAPALASSCLPPDNRTSLAIGGVGSDDNRINRDVARYFGGV